jgi:hypothetical protein
VVRVKKFIDANQKKGQDKQGAIGYRSRKWGYREINLANWLSPSTTNVVAVMQAPSNK